MSTTYGMPSFSPLSPFSPSSLLSCALEVFAGEIMDAYSGGIMSNAPDPSSGVGDGGGMQGLLNGPDMVRLCQAQSARTSHGNAHQAMNFGEDLHDDACDLSSSGCCAEVSSSYGPFSRLTRSLPSAWLVSIIPPRFPYPGEVLPRVLCPPGEPSPDGAASAKRGRAPRAGAVPRATARLPHDAPRRRP